MTIEHETCSGSSGALFGNGAVCIFVSGPVADVEHILLLAKTIGSRYIITVRRMLLACGQGPVHIRAACACEGTSLSIVTPVQLSELLPSLDRTMIGGSANELYL